MQRNSTRILAKDVYIDNNTRVTGNNNNDLIIGPSGAGKTRGYVIPNILQAEGSLVITDSWPGQARTLFGDHERFEQTYFSTFKNMYFSGAGARRDEDGYYWITGRVDDVLHVSGHRRGTAEIESALVAHPKIAEAAVVGIPHNIKGQALYAYVTLNHGEEPSPELYAEVRNWVRKEIGPLATPDVLHWTDSLPKTRSGKIMRRILRKIAAGDTSNLGDTSTLADPGVVEKLLEEKQAIAMPS